LTVEQYNYLLDNIFLSSYPNPTSGNTSISISLPLPSNIEMNIMDILRNSLFTKTNSYYNAGLHSFDLDLSNFSSGVYFCTIKTDIGMKTIKIVKN
ncbi:MAG: T9SS type A sorting domain-containing protein, partial [Candidatus Kapabacteria bacterium]|nr:T9SS type A sorting domain-containing protein [Candidatus Kapabacteria bacterium]